MMKIDLLVGVLFSGGAWALLGLIAFIAVMLACDLRRVLERQPSAAWQQPEYVRRLGNVLHMLAQRRFASPWPEGGTSWAGRWFEYRLTRAVRSLLKEQAATFLEQHLSLGAWLQAHQETLGQLLQQRQREQAHERLLSETGPQERRALLAFLNQHADDARGRQPHDEAGALGRQAIARLDRLAIIFREHGYQLSPDFALMDQLEHAGERELVEQLAPLLAGVA